MAGSANHKWDQRIWKKAKIIKNILEATVIQKETFIIISY